MYTGRERVCDVSFVSLQGWRTTKTISWHCEQLVHIYLAVSTNEFSAQCLVDQEWKNALRLSAANAFCDYFRLRTDRDRIDRRSIFSCNMTFNVSRKH